MGSATFLESLVELGPDAQATFLSLFVQMNKMKEEMANPLGIEPLTHSIA